MLVGRTHPKALAGIACMGGWYLLPHMPSSSATRAPVLLCHGEEDDDVPIERQDEACAALKRDRFRVTSHSYDALGRTEIATELTVLAAPKNFITECLPPIIDKKAKKKPPGLGAGKGGGIAVPQCKLDAKRGTSSTSSRKSAEGGGGDRTRRNACPCSDSDSAASPSLPEDAVNALAEKRVSAAFDAETAAAVGPATRPATKSKRGAMHASPPEATDISDSPATVAPCRLLSVDERESGRIMQAVIQLASGVSLVDLELQVGAQQLELRLDGGDGPPALVVPLPRPVNLVAGETAKYSKKSGRLTVSLQVDAA